MQASDVVSARHEGRFGRPVPVLVIGRAPREGPPFCLRGWASPRGGLTRLRCGAPPLRGVYPGMIQNIDCVNVITSWRQLLSLSIKWELSQLCKLCKLVVLLFGGSEFRASYCWVAFFLRFPKLLYMFVLPS